MKQITVKTALQALEWLHKNPHHIVGTEFHDTKVDEKGRALATHVYYQNYHEKVRVPIGPISKQVCDHICVNMRPFDTRMYALTRKGKNMLRRAGIEVLNEGK